jgi:predicted phage-related endonuclease
MGSKPINISASRGAAILGMSKWSTPLETWLKIMESREPEWFELSGYEPVMTEENAAMRWGTAFEDSICKIASKIRAVDGKRNLIVDREKLHVHEYLHYVTCHIDGIYGLTEELHEGKTTNTRAYFSNWGKPGTDKVPPEYQIQVQHQMLATKKDKCIVSVLVFPRMPDEFEAMGWRFTEQIAGAKFLERYEDGEFAEVGSQVEDWARALAEMGFYHQYEIAANPELQEMMVKHYRFFWEEYVEKRQPPTPINYKDIKRLVKQPIGTIIATDQIERLSREYKELTAEASKAAKRKDEVKTVILDWMRKQEAPPIDDDSTEKWILKDMQGKKLNTFNGKVFR